MNNPNEKEHDIWTTTEKNRKGKSQAMEGTSHQLICDNDFDALRLLNEPLVIKYIT